MKVERLIWVLMASSAMFLGACSNDDDEGGQPIVEPERALVSIAGSGDEPDAHVVSFKKVSTIEVSALYGGTTSNHMGEIAVELEAAPSLAAAFNTANGTNYPVLPQQYYEFESILLTIPDGQKTSNTLNIIVEAMGQLDPAKEYLLPVTVKQLYSEKAYVSLDEGGKTIYLLLSSSDQEPQPGNDPQNWSVVRASSEWQYPELSIYTASRMLDGDVSTYWHTDPAAGLSQWAIIDMKVNKLINGFYITNRQWDAGEPQGTPRIVTFEVSDTGRDGEWSLVQEYFELPQQPDTEEGRPRIDIPLDRPVTGRFFRVSILSSWTNSAYSFIAEIGIL